jgi:medium-chain acyl-[acyl-carrier-protein] hydrolase
LPHTVIVSGRRAPTVVSGEPAIHALPDDVFVAELIRRYDAIPRAVLDEPDLMALFVPVLKADFALFETHKYRHEPPLGCALAMYGGLDDPQTAEMAGWAGLFDGAQRRRLFAGGHFYMANGPDQPRLLAAALVEDVLRPFRAA